MATFVSEPGDNPELRAKMKELLDMILGYFELHINDEEETI